MTRPVTPPKVPTSYVAAPILPSALAEARTATARYGQRLSSGLNVLAGLNAVGALTWLGTLAWGVQALNGLKHHWPKDVDIDWKVTLDYSLPLAIGLGLLTLLTAGFNIWCFLVARNTVQAIQNQTLAPGPSQADQTVRGVRTILPWLTLSQWLPVLSFVLLTLPTIAGMAALTSGDSDHKASSLAGTLLTYGLSSLIQTIPYVVIPWLLLASVKRWLTAVATRTARPDFPVRPFAGSLNNWLVFLMVVFGFYALSGILFGLVSGALLAMVGSQMPEADADLQQLAPLMTALCAVMFLFGLLYSYEAVLAMWLRAFANASSLVMDSEGRPDAASLQAIEDW